MKRVIGIVGLTLAAAGAGALARGAAAQRPAATDLHGAIQTTASSSTASGEPRVIVGAGRVEAVSEDIAISAELPGRLHAVLVDEGDAVRAGDTIATMENAEYLARVESARASVALSRAELERLINGAREEERSEARAAEAQAAAILDQTRAELPRRENLLREGAIPREEMERAARDVRVAQARYDELAERKRLVEADPRPEDVARARAALAGAEAAAREALAMWEKTRIRAPIDGIILRRHLQAGESVAVSPAPTAIVSMADVSHLRVRMDVDETDIAGVRVGQRAWVTADAFGERRFSGRVVRVGSMLGRKNVQTDAPAERQDIKVLETLIALDPGHSLPVGLRVDAFITREP